MRRARHRSVPVLATVAALVLVTGCGVQSNGGTGAVKNASVASRTLVDLMVSAATTTPHQMTRRYESHIGPGTTPRTLVYTETVNADGTGRFAIDPLEVSQPSFSTGQESLFLLLQKQREGFFFEHRDFSIQDVDLFHRNWRVVDTGSTTQLVERTCAQLEVRRKKGADRTYHLAVDIENGLVLRAEERDDAGGLLSLVEVETLDLTPDFSGVVFHQPIAQRTPLDPPLSGLSFTPLQPKLLPQGYALLEASEIDDTISNESWAEFVFSDGLEEVFFLHGGKQQGQMSTAGGNKKSGVARWLELGPWTIVWGNAQRERFLVMGKLPREKLFDLVESAFF